MRTVLSIASALAVAALVIPGGSAAGAAGNDLTETFHGAVGTGTYYPSWNQESMSSPAYGDVTGNGRPNLVIGGMDGRLAVFDIDTAAVTTFTIGAGNIHSSPALADIDGDGTLDIVVGTTDGDAVAIKGNGQEIFRRKTNLDPTKPNDIYSTPAVGDIDNDGRPEIVVSSDDHYLHAWNHDGTDVAGFPVWQKDTTWSSPALADIDNDGFAEIIVAWDIDYNTGPHVGCGTWGASVRAIEHTGVEKWHTCIPNEIITSSPAIADIDADGDLDIAIGAGVYFSAIGETGGVAAAKRLWVLDAATGSVAPGWPVDVGGISGVAPALGNLDADPQLEVVTSSDSGEVVAYEHNGTKKWGQCGMRADFTCPFALFNAVGSAVSIADVDNDGANEVVAFVHTEVLVLNGLNGARERTASPPVGYVPRAQPTVVSHDGAATIYVQYLKEVTGAGRSAGDHLHVYGYTTGTPLGATPWPMFQQNPARTGSTQTAWAGAAWMDPWLAAVYEDLLNRTIDSGGADYWKGRLASDLTKSELAFQFATTDEWLGVVVDDLYQSVLGRPPDAGGRAYWVAQLKAGRPTADVVSSFFSSPEYFQSVGGTNALFVNALYQGILGRNPDAGGHAFWTQRLDGGEPRGTLSSLVFTSYESGGLRVDGLYATLLARSPDTGGRHHWANYLTTGDQIALAALLVDSAEYQDRAESRFP